MDDRIKAIADHYGYEVQSRQLIENMAKLTQAVNEEWKDANGFLHVTHDRIVDNIAEKVAGTEIMLDQIKYLLKIEQGTENWRERKLERTLENIEPEKMATVVYGIHGISKGRDYREYIWTVPEGMIIKVGDIVTVNTKRGKENALVTAIKEIPLTEVKKHKTVVGVIDLEECHDKL